MTGPALHTPVLLEPVIAALNVRPDGTYVDGTFGAGGYTRALLDHGAERVIALDRDPEAIEAGAALVAASQGRLTLVEGRFGDLAAITEAEDAVPLHGVTLDIGVSSMQLDRAERGFSFMRDGPLDMRMGRDGPSAAALVNDMPEDDLAEILWLYGEERASRRIARAIAAARSEAPVTTTARLAEIVSGCLPRPRPGQPHPATRSFQALRIAVNDELGELVRALEGAEHVLGEGGVLAVVSFHSLEDRIVKRFMQLRSDRAPRASRHAPDPGPAAQPAFETITRKPVEAGEAEIAANPRARSARLRAARRTAAPAGRLPPRALGLPEPKRARAMR